jgi:serine/threonine-protein kinase
MTHDDTPHDSGAEAERPTEPLSDAADEATDTRPDIAGTLDSPGDRPVVGRDPRAPRDNRVIDERYRVVDTVGTGGMGTVLKVEDLALSEIVALKLLHADFADDADALDRFRHEVKLARRVTHRNVVRTYEFGLDSDRPYLTMEYVAGESLRDLLDAAGPLPADRARTIAGAIGRGLHAAHRGGVLHHDLKPENILVADNGRVALSDFGIAEALRPDDADGISDGGLRGTPEYLSPEHVESGDVDQRSDIFAFGILLFEMLAGQLPWHAESIVEWATIRLREPAPSLADVAPDAPEDLVRAVDASLARRAENRPQDLPELLELLDLDHGGRGRLDASFLRAQEGPADTPVPTDMSPAHAPTREDTTVRLAVAPFTYEGPDDRTYLGPGLRSDLVHHLSRLDDLELRMRDEHATDAARRQTPGKLGRTLEVDVVVSGAIRSTAAGLALDIRLTSVRDETVLWSDRFPLDSDRDPYVSNTVTRHLAEQLGLPPDDADPPTSLPPRANALLMQATDRLRAHWYTDLEDTVAQLERARRISHDHPRVMAELAVARARQSYLDPRARDRHVDEATSLARRAIDESDSDRLRPRIALAMAHFNAGRYGRASATLRAALLRDDNSAPAHDLMGRMLLEIGPLDRATDHLQRALELNPFLFRARWDLARGWGLRRRWSRMVDVLAEPVDDQSQELARAMHAARLSLWHPAEPLEAAIDRNRDTLTSSPGPFRELLDVRATGTFDADAHHAVRQTVVETHHGSRFGILVLQTGAEMALYAGDPDLAFEFVDAAIAKGLTDLVWLQACPLFDDHREDRRFIEARARVTGRVDSVRYGEGKE